MQEIIIDFKKYSSLRIGERLPVKVIDMHDVGAYLIDNNSIKLQNSLEINQHTFRKPALYKNATLTFNTPLLATKHSYLQIEPSPESIQWRIIGKANNIIVSPSAKNLAVLGNSFNYISLNDDFIEIGASVNSLQSFLFFKKHDIAGLEFLKNLPGNIGALCNMNAGMKQYEISQSLKSLNINGQWIDIQQAKLVYRRRESVGVIFAARFHKKMGFRHELLPLFSQMRETHPKEPSCGSCFKNPPNDYAGRLLEASGMKGFFINNVGFSNHHANFLVNLGGATYNDAINIIQIAKQRVYEFSGVKLECEVQICK